MKPVPPTDQDPAAHFFQVSAVKLQHDFLPRLEAALTVIPEDLLWVREGRSTNSPGNILLHMAGNLRQWVIAGIGGMPDDRVRDAEFNTTGGLTKRELLVRVTTTVNEACSVLRSVSTSQSLDQRRIQVYDVTALEAAYHAVEHFSYHLGQIIHIAKRLSGADLRLYPF